MFLVIVLVLLFLLHSLFINIYHNNTNFNVLTFLLLRNFKDTLKLIYDFLLGGLESRNYVLFKYGFKKGFKFKNWGRG